MNEEFYHEPVMVQEVIHYLLSSGPGQLYVDATVGGGGHAHAVLCWTGPGGKKIGRLIGIDRDPEALKAAGQRLGGFTDKVALRKAGFRDIPSVLKEEGIYKADGVLMDLGASYHQLTSSGRGFSFRSDSPLDMRMDPELPESAADLLARLRQDEIRIILREYGEEKYPGRIARVIVEKAKSGHPVRTTRELAELVEKAVPGGGKTRLHPATRTFMALRIAVNHELEQLEKTLEILPEILNEGGRAVVISYHSLEDRLVKR